MMSRASSAGDTIACFLVGSHDSQTPVYERDCGSANQRTSRCWFGRGPVVSAAHGCASAISGKRSPRRGPPSARVHGQRPRPPSRKSTRSLAEPRLQVRSSSVDNRQPGGCGEQLGNNSSLSFDLRSASARRVGCGERASSVAADHVVEACGADRMVACRQSARGSVHQAILRTTGVTDEAVRGVRPAARPPRSRQSRRVREEDNVEPEAIDALALGNAARAWEAEVTRECCEERARVVCLAPCARWVKREREPVGARMRTRTTVALRPHDDLRTSIDRHEAGAAHAPRSDEIDLGIRVGHQATCRGGRPNRHRRWRARGALGDAELSWTTNDREHRRVHPRHHRRGRGPRRQWHDACSQHS